MDAAYVNLAVYNGMADWEVGHITAHVNNPTWQRDPGALRIRTVGESGEPVTSMGGLRISPDIALGATTPAGDAMLVLPGADSWMAGENGAFADAARACLAEGTPVAAICGATVGLAVAGLLDERRHTSNAPQVLEATGYAGRDLYRDQPAVTDGDLITASATAPVEFAREVFARLELYEPDVLASWYALYGEGDPSGYAELAAREAS